MQEIAEKTEIVESTMTTKPWAITSTMKIAENAIRIGVSSRALFNLEDSHSIFMEQGTEAFEEYMINTADKTLRPGVAFNLVKKLLALNTPGTRDKVEVVLMSRNSPFAATRMHNSMIAHQLDIERMFLTQGESRVPFCKALNIDLFLSANDKEVIEMLDEGIPSATVWPHSQLVDDNADTKIRFAFDGDAVIFSDESEKQLYIGGLPAFQSYEQQNKDKPLQKGPLFNFLEKLSNINKNFKEKDRPIAIALVTARGVGAFSRPLLTLKHHQILIDQSFFLAGESKGPTLEAFGADIFFDDSLRNCNSGVEYVGTCHVPHGVNNK